MIVENITKSATLVDRGKVAGTFLARLKGLLGSPPLKKGQGLLLKHEKSIHTLFMRFPIDVVYLNKHGQIIKIDVNMVPFRLGKFVFKAESILELPVGVIQETQTTVGDTLRIIENPIPQKS